MWREDKCKVTICSEIDQDMTCLVKDIALQKEFYSTIVYAQNGKEERRALWTYLSQLEEGMTIPWLVLGDFNNVFHSDDRIGGTPVTLAEVCEFQDCLEIYKLEKMASNRSIYTWNDKGTTSRVFSKIDWLFVNGEWADKMPECRTTFLNEGVSDHSPMHMKSTNAPWRVKSNFKYCNMWRKHDQFKSIVLRCWQKQVQACYMYQVVQK